MVMKLSPREIYEAVLREENSLGIQQRRACRSTREKEGWRERRRNRERIDQKDVFEASRSRGFLSCQWKELQRRKERLGIRLTK